VKAKRTHSSNMDAAGKCVVDRCRRSNFECEIQRMQSQGLSNDTTLSDKMLNEVSVPFCEKSTEDQLRELETMSAQEQWNAMVSLTEQQGVLLVEARNNERMKDKNTKYEMLVAFLQSVEQSNYLANLLHGQDCEISFDEMVWVARNYSDQNDPRVTKERKEKLDKLISLIRYNLFWDQSVDFQDDESIKALLF